MRPLKFTYGRKHRIDPKVDFNWVYGKPMDGFPADHFSVARPVRELKEFVKVNLKPGESRRLTVRLTPEAFAFYDMDIHDFRIEPGQFTISVGNSSANLPLSSTVTL